MDLRGDIKVTKICNRFIQNYNFSFLRSCKYKVTICYPFIIFVEFIGYLCFNSVYYRVGLVKLTEVL